MANDAHIAADLDAPPITRILADFVAAHPSRGWEDSVDDEAHRSFLNWVGCAIGASRHPTVEAALAAVTELEPSAQAMILGRSERVDVASAALLNGITSHTFDFDDTHLKTIIHPAGPVASAALALAERHRATGRELVDAIVLGVDVECRVGNAIYPDHYDRGWHITGSTGMLGAAAACAQDPQARHRPHGDGAGHRRVAADRRARAVRIDDQGLSRRRRRARRTHLGVDGPARLHRLDARP